MKVQQHLGIPAANPLIGDFPVHSSHQMLSMVTCTISTHFPGSGMCVS